MADEREPPAIRRVVSFCTCGALTNLMCTRCYLASDGEAQRFVCSATVCRALHFATFHPGGDA